MSEQNPTYAHEKPANKSSALEQALAKLEKAMAALKLIHVTDDGPSGDCAGRALKELDDV